MSWDPWPQRSDRPPQPEASTSRLRGPPPPPPPPSTIVPHNHDTEEFGALSSASPLKAPSTRGRWQEYGGPYRSIDDTSKPWTSSPTASHPMPIPDVVVRPVPAFQSSNPMQTSSSSKTTSSSTSLSSDSRSGWSVLSPLPTRRHGVTASLDVVDDNTAGPSPQRSSSMRRLVKKIRRGLSRRRRSGAVDSPEDHHAPANRSVRGGTGTENASKLVHATSLRRVHTITSPQSIALPISSTKVQPHEWKACGYYARPIIRGVVVHNTSSPPTTHGELQHIDDTDLTPEEVFDSLPSPNGLPGHPERWKLGIEHPALPPRPERWPSPDPTEPQPFPWELQLNPFLGHVLFGVPRLYYDLREEPDRAMYGLQPSEDPLEGACRPLFDSDYAQPATWPFVTHMYINALADDMAEKFAWPFMVINVHGIKVRDVLEKIYLNFQQLVSEREYMSRLWTNARREETGRAYRRRVNVSSSDNEWRAMAGEIDPCDGHRRVDYLGQRTLFRGLAPNPDRTGWVLYLGQKA